jgi:hypothetical protein
MGLLQEGVGALTGDKATEALGAAEASTKPYDFGYLGTVNQAGYDANGNKLNFGAATDQAVGAGLQMAPYFLAPETMLGKMPGGVITKIMANTGLGYLVGSGTSLSQGKPAGAAFAPNASNITGAVAGAATTGAISALGAWGRSASGITTQMQNALKNGGITTEELNNYLDAAKARVTDIRATSPLTLAANKLDEAASSINAQAAAAGEAVGQAKAALGNVPMNADAVSTIASDFKARALEQYGLNLAPNEDGVIEATAASGRTPPISTSDANRIAEAYTRIMGLTDTTARNGADVIKYLDNAINYSRAANNGFSPLEGLMYSARKPLDDVVRAASPGLAEANDAASLLYQLQGEVQKMAGGQQQRGELLMRRIFSGDKSGEVQDLFDKIKAATGIDLINQAVLARFAIDTVGDPSQESLLTQMLGEASEGGGGGGIWRTAANVGRAIARHTFANPANIGTNLVSGSTPSMIPSLLSRGAMEVGSYEASPGQQE